MRRPLRIAMISKLYYPPWVGGLEIHAAELAQTLVASGEDVQVQAIVGQHRRQRFSRETLGGVDVCRAATILRIARTPITLGFRRLLRDARADLYHFHFPYPFGEMSALLSKLQAPIVVTYHHDIVRQKQLLAMYRPFLHRFLSRAERIVAWSPQLIEYSPILQRYRHKSVVIPGGIDTRRFVPTEASRTAAAALRKSLATEGPVILFVGRLVYYKGLNYLLEAMKQLRATLVLVGEGADRAALEARASELGVRDRVRFVGPVSAAALPLYYQASDLFVLPSCQPTEAFGLVQLEAHASGIPSICTDLPTGVKYVNQSGETGLVVKTADAQALADGLGRLIEDRELRSRLGSQAQARAWREFDIRTCAARMLTLYREVLGE